MMEHEPVRQEEAYAQAKKKQRAVRQEKAQHKKKKEIGYGILANAQEPGEPSLYLFNLTDAPQHMKQRLLYNARDNKYKYEFLHEDGPDTLDGLVNPNSEEGEERTNEVMEYLKSKCSEEFEFNPPSRVLICFSFTLAHV